MHEKFHSSVWTFSMIVLMRTSHHLLATVFSVDCFVITCNRSRTKNSIKHLPRFVIISLSSKKGILASCMKKSLSLIIHNFEDVWDCLAHNLSYTIYGLKMGEAESICQCPVFFSTSKCYQQMINCVSTAKSPYRTPKLIINQLKGPGLIRVANHKPTGLCTVDIVTN